MTDDDGASDDPFAGLILDEVFLREATRHEPSAAERAATAAAARAARRSAARKARRSRRSDRRRRVIGRMKRFKAYVPGLVLVAGVGLLWSGQRGPTAPDAPPWASGMPVIGSVGGADRPTPQAAESDVPLGVPAPAPAGEGSYDFMATQQGSGAPVTYDPCRPISLVLNQQAAPPGAERLLAEAIAQISAATGLRFDIEGPTDEPPIEERSPFQPARYGDRWAPVLIAWTAPGQLPSLAGRVAGIGGSTRLATTTSNDQEVYVSGIVALDGPQLGALLEAPDGWPHTRAVIIHELGHLVGLDHVGDPSQIMHDEAREGVVRLQPGDLRGLNQLGKGSCIPLL